LVDGCTRNKQKDVMPSPSADDMKTTGLPIGKYFERSCYGLVPTATEKKHEKFRHGSQCSGRDSNGGPSEHKSGSSTC